MNLDIVFHVDLNDSAVLNIAISNVSNYFTAIEGQKADVVDERNDAGRRTGCSCGNCGACTPEK